MPRSGFFLNCVRYTIFSAFDWLALDQIAKPANPLSEPCPSLFKLKPCLFDFQVVNYNWLPSFFLCFFHSNRCIFLFSLEPCCRITLAIHLPSPSNALK